MPGFFMRVKRRQLWAQHKFSPLPSYFTWCFVCLQFLQGLQGWYVSHWLTCPRVFLVTDAFADSLTWLMDMLYFSQTFVVISYLLMALLPWFCGLICFCSAYYNFNEMSGELRKICLHLKCQKPSFFYSEISISCYLRNYLNEKYF